MPLPVIPLVAIGAAYLSLRDDEPPAQEETPTVAPDTQDDIPPEGETVSEAWPEIEQCAGEVPADFLRRFIEAESGFNPCSVGRVSGGRVWEAGLGQVYFETAGQRVYGVTADELRAACDGLTQKQIRPLTPEERVMHARVAADQAADLIRSAQSRLSARGLQWDQGDVLCMAKMVHNLPVLASEYLTAAVNSDSASNWDAYRRYLDTMSVEDAIAIYPQITTPSKGGIGGQDYLPLTRYTKNAERVGRG